MLDWEKWSQKGIGRFRSEGSKVKQLDEPLSKMGSEVSKVGLALEVKEGAEKEDTLKSRKELTEEDRVLARYQPGMELRIGKWCNALDEDLTTHKYSKGILAEMRPRGGGVQRKGFFVAGLKPELNELGNEARQIVQVRAGWVDLLKQWEEALRSSPKEVGRARCVRKTENRTSTFSSRSSRLRGVAAKTCTPGRRCS